MSDLTTASVAMAAYNGERFLVRQLDSILEQLCEGDELIVSYDESTDGTLAVLRSYEATDPRVKILINENHGIIENFSNAISACSGDVVFISDQDDEWLLGKRERVMTRLNETHADLLIHDAAQVDVDGNVVIASMFVEHGISAGLLRNFIKPRYSGCCMAFPARTRSLILPMPKSVKCYDHWIGMACEAYGKVEFMDEVLLHHRLHGGNATSPRRPVGIVARQRANLFVALMGCRGTMLR